MRFETLHLLICIALRDHQIVVEVLHKIRYYHICYRYCCCYSFKNYNDCVECMVGGVYKHDVAVMRYVAPT